MTRRQVRAEPKAATERDHSWTEARDEEIESDGDVPTDEYGGLDEYAKLAQEFRG